MTLATAVTDDETVPLRAADLIIRRCLDLKPGQTFLLISDETTDAFPDLFGRAASACETEFEHFFVPEDLQARAAEAFTPALESAMRRAQGVLVATSGAERCSTFRITLTTDKRGAGCRVATMPGATLDILRTAIIIDYEEVFESSLRLTRPLLDGTECRITTFSSDETEYHLFLSLGGLSRTPIQSLGIIPADAWGNVPAGEIFIAPLESSADGEYLVNGAVGNEKLTGGREALLTFERGQLVRHRYVGTQLEVAELVKARQIAESRSHGVCWRVIAELGIGLNRLIPAITGIPLVDEKKYGTVHIAVGHNMGYGGRNDCRSIHCDITTSGPTVEIDGRRVIERGTHIVGDEWLESYQRHMGNGTSSGASGAALKPSAFVIRNGHFLVRRVTGSGRETLYPIGDAETSVLAQRLVECANDDVLDLTSAQARLGLSRETVDALVAMLSYHRVIRL